MNIRQIISYFIIKLKTMENKIVYLVVDKDNREWAFENEKPIQRLIKWYPKMFDDKGYNRFIELPKGTIKKLIGKELTFDDEPYEWSGNNAIAENINYNIDLDEMNLIRGALLFSLQQAESYKEKLPEQYNKLKNIIDKFMELPKPEN